jgi:predicted Zn-dependent peptidase
MRSIVFTALSAFVVSTVSGCTSTVYEPKPLVGVVIPIKDTTPKPKPPAKERPPESGPTREVKFPKVVWTELANGLRIATVEQHGLPIVEVRVAVLGGRASDGEHPGAAQLTGVMLREGGAGALSGKDIIARAEALGGSLDVSTGSDRTTIGMGVTKDNLAPALDLISTVVTQPQFQQNELEKAKKRMVDSARDAAKTNGAWAANIVLFKDLFAMPAETHPYSFFAATAEDLNKLSASDCKATHKRLYVPKNTVVIVAGDTTPADVKTFAEKAFGKFKGGDAPVISFTDPNPQEGLKITVVHRPKAPQSEVIVGLLGPQRKDAGWASWDVMNQVLGGGPAARMFMNIREKQSLAYRAYSRDIELGRGPTVMTAAVGTMTAKTGVALNAILEELHNIATTAPSEEEVEDAKRHLMDVFALQMETVGAVADELVHHRVFGLADDYDDAYRRELGQMTPALVNKAASDHIRDGHAVIVVAGDADIVGPMLRHFGEVKVVDPVKNFERIRSIPMDANAPFTPPPAEPPPAAPAPAPTPAP